MKKTYYLLLPLLLAYLSSTAQQIPLTGVVSIQNSEYNTGTRQYVRGASVTADYARDKLTDSEGYFMLQFVGEKNGSSTQVKVYKTGLETVNHKALGDVIIGRTPALRIYMCKEGELAANQIRYQNISLKNLYAERDRRIRQLEKGGASMTAEINRLKEELNVEIYGKNDAIQQLDQQIEAIEKKLPEFAKKLALVNLDDASELYKKAYEFYLNGKTQQAISLLGVNQLLEKGLEATSDIQSLRKQRQIIDEAIALLEQQIEQTVRSLELGAELLELEFRYQKASEYYQAIITVLESQPEGREEDIARFNNQAGLQLKEAGHYAEAFSYFQKALAIDEQLLEKNHPVIARDYNNLAQIYQDLGKIKEALTAQQKALAIDEQVFKKNHPRIARDYNNLAQIYKDLGKPDEALAAQQKSLAINEQVFEKNHPRIARDYNNLAQIYKAMGQLDKALLAQQKALVIDEQVFEKNHPTIAIRYNNLAQIYRALGQLNEALVTQQKALDISKKVLLESHPNIIILSQNLSAIYYDMGLLHLGTKKYSDALIAFNQALDSYWDKAVVYNYIGLCHQYLAEYTQAITAYQAALQLDSSLKEGYYFNNIGIAYLKNKQFSKALEAFQAYETLDINNGRVYRNYAMYHALKNDPDEAINMLQKAIELGFDDSNWLKIDDSMSSLRSLPVFHAILKQME